MSVVLFSASGTFGGDSAAIEVKFNILLYLYLYIVIQGTVLGSHREKLNSDFFSFD